MQIFGSNIGNIASLVKKKIECCKNLQIQYNEQIKFIIDFNLNFNSQKRGKVKCRIKLPISHRDNSMK